MTASRRLREMVHTPPYWFVMGTVWAVLGVSELLLAPGHILMSLVAAVWLLLAVGSLVTAFVLRRRQRSGPGADSREPPGLPPSPR
jgi:hypothetical protein